MARLPSIPKAKLNTAIKQLPKPVQSHLKRCRMLAGYVMERIEAEDWFIESGVNAESIISAIGYHDIGKCYIPKESLYFEHCTTPANKKAYRTHTDEGVAFVERECDIRLSDYRPTSPGGILYSVLLQHHRYLDGSGFPEATEDTPELSFAAKLCMVIDTFDNLLFVGNTGEPDINKAIEEISALSGGKLDAATVEMFLSDIPTLRNFVKHISRKENEARRSDNEEYGIVLRYLPYYNIGKQRVSGYRVALMLHDPYYGLMKGASFLQIAERTGQIGKLEKAAFEKLCLELELLFENTAKRPRFILELSPENFGKKNFVKDYISILKQYSVYPESICFAFKEAELLHTNENWQEVLGQLKAYGIGIMIDEFGDTSSMISALGDVQVDMLGLKKDYTQHMEADKRVSAVVSGLAKTARSLHINMLAVGVTNTRQEAEYLNMQVKYAMGELYGTPLTFRELRKQYNDKPYGIGG